MSKVQLPQSGEPAPEIKALDRKWIGYKAARLERAVEVADDQMLKSSGWLTASLLIVNAGAGLATLNAAQQGVLLSGSAICFVAGMTFATLSAVTIQSLQEMSSGRAEKLLDFWKTAEIYGTADPEREQHLLGEVQKVERWAILAPLLGWISGMLFLAGAVFFAVSAKERENEARARCLPIQRDILSATPALKDNREIFVSLGCKAEGAKTPAVLNAQKAKTGG